MSNYLIDAGRVYYLDGYYFDKPALIPDADYSSLEVLGKWFARDHLHVYFLYRAVDGADPSMFTYLGGYNDHWAKDHAQAYYFWPTKAARQYRGLASDSVDRFAILPNCRFTEYAGDAEYIYYRGKRVRGADAPSFQVMTQVDWGDGADLRSFHFARDAERIYFDGQSIKEADYHSFAVIHEPGLGHQEYGVDARNAYYQSQKTGKIAMISHGDLPAPVRERFLAGKRS
jgi:DKNYY family